MCLGAADEAPLGRPSTFTHMPMCGCSPGHLRGWAEAGRTGGGRPLVTLSGGVKERSVGSRLVGLRGDAGVWRERRMEVAAAWVDGCVEVSTMTETLHRPVVGSRERYPLAADAFLYAAMIYLLVGVVQQGIAYLLSGGDLGTWTPPVWLEAIGALGMPLAVIGGPLLAWRAYGRHLGWRELVAAVVGAVLGGAVFGFVFFALFALTRLIPSPVPEEEEGPWGMVIVAALAVVAFLAKPVIVAVRDLAGTKEHARRHWLRLAVVVLALIAVIASVFVGGETAELGIFLLLPAVPAAVAAIAMDWKRVHQHQSETVS